MFGDASVFTGVGLNGWDVSKVTEFTFMFQNSVLFNADISAWDVSSVTSFYQTFKGATAFNQDLSGWAISSASTFQEMFDGASAFNRDLCDWGTRTLLLSIFATGMFSSTSCTNTGDPDFNASPEGPFCHNC